MGPNVIFVFQSSHSGGAQRGKYSMVSPQNNSRAGFVILLTCFSNMYKPVALEGLYTSNNENAKIIFPSLHCQSSLTNFQKN